MHRYGKSNALQLLSRRQLGAHALPLAPSPPINLYDRYRLLKVLSGHYNMAAYCTTFDQSGSLFITGADDRSGDGL